MVDWSKVAWPAPAKLNLFLHITGRTASGYHTLQSIFQFLDYSDELYFEPASDGVISRSGTHPGISEEDDLTLRAACLLQSHTDCSQGAHIRLHKTLPIGGGIGGGSSDAATVLQALNHIWDTGLDLQALADLGLQLGADVPVFVHGKACWAEGVGEVIQAVDIPEPWYVVVFPNVHVSTAEIFSSGELTRNTPPITIADFLAGRSWNDCEPVVRKQVSAVDEALNWLQQYAPARMTGTGACIFAAFDDEDQARAVVASCPTRWRAFAASGMNISPLHRMLEAVR